MSRLLAAFPKLRNSSRVESTSVKIAPRAMFATQIYGTVLGGFVNYGIMKSVVKSNRDLLANNNGDSTWSGAYIQSYNTNAASWALAKYLYTSGNTYEIVPLGIFIGAGVVILHRVFVHVCVRLATHRFQFMITDHRVVLP